MSGQISALKTLGEQIDQLREKAVGFADAWAQAEQDVQQRSQAAVAAADAAQSQMEETMARLQATNQTVLDEIQGALAEFGDNPWAQYMDQGIRAVEEGKASIEEFRRLYGGVKFDLVEGRKLTSLWLLELDPGQFRRRTQEIRQAIEQEAIGIEEVVELLRSSADQWAQSLIRLYEAFKAGKVSVEAVIEEARKAQRATGVNSQVGALAEGIEDILTANLEDYT